MRSHVVALSLANGHGPRVVTSRGAATSGARGRRSGARGRDGEPPLYWCGRGADNAGASSAGFRTHAPAAAPPVYVFSLAVDIITNHARACWVSPHILLGGRTRPYQFLNVTKGRAPNTTHASAIA